MKRIKNALLWFLLLEKRLFKKAGYVILLAAVPALALIVALVSARSDGAIKVALCCADRSDPIAVAICEELVSDSDLVGIREVGSREEAERLVAAGTVDTSWIVEGGIRDKLAEYAAGRDPSGPVYTIFVREDKPMLLLAREKLSGAVSQYVMRESMKRAIRTDLGDADDETLDGYYFDAEGKSEILKFEYADGGNSADESIGYLLIPVRGILSVMVVLCGLAAAIYYKRDVEDKVFFPAAGTASLVFEAGYILTGVIPAAIVAEASLYAAGVTVSPGREAAALALFCLTTTLFCTLMMRLIPSGRALAAVTPVAVVAIAAVSPIFFDVANLKAIQTLTPTYHYLMATHNGSYLLSAAIYAAVAAALCEAVRIIREIPAAIGRKKIKS